MASPVSQELIRSIAQHMARQNHVVGHGEFKYRENPNADNSMRDAFLKENTERPDFNEWFKGSQLVDDDGNPLLLFHGDMKDTPTDDGEHPHDFSQYDTWFTPSEENAGYYGNVTAAYVRAAKVFKMDADGNCWSNIPINLVKGLNVLAPDKDYPDDTTADEIAQTAIRSGYDAAWIKNVDDDVVADQIFVKGPVDLWIPRG